VTPTAWFFFFIISPFVPSTRSGGAIRTMRFAPRCASTKGTVPDSRALARKDDVTKFGVENGAP
jgi:hypothetical protein